MAHANPGDDLNSFVQAGQAAVSAARSIARQHGGKMVFVGWADPDGSSSFSGPDSLRGIAEDADTCVALARLATSIASEAAVNVLRSLLSREQTEVQLSTIARSQGVELRALLNHLHDTNLIFQPEPGLYRLTANGEHAIGMLFWAALQVRRPQSELLNQAGWFDA